AGAARFALQPEPSSRSREPQNQDGRSQQFRARSFRRLTALERREIAMHCRSRSITVFRIIRTRLYHHLIELQELLPIRPGAQFRIYLREIEPVFSSASLVKKFAQAINVCSGSSRAFGRHVTFRSNK